MNINFNDLTYLNTEYIKKHKLSQKKISDAGIELVKWDEVFVQYPKWSDYYGSNYGRLISMKTGKPEIRTPYINGTHVSGKPYLGYKLTKVVRGKQKELSISMHRLVADIFLPNYWKHLDRNQLQAHHLDHTAQNNFVGNIALLPTRLHQIMNRVKKMIYLKGGTYRVMNVYQIMQKTGLSMEEVVTACKGKPLKSQGKYSVFEVKGHLIGFMFMPDKKKKR